MINSKELIGVYMAGDIYTGNPPEGVPVAVPWYDQYGNLGYTATEFAYVPTNHNLTFIGPAETLFGCAQRAVTWAQMIAIWHKICVIDRPVGIPQSVIAAGNGSVTW